MTRYRLLKLVKIIAELKSAKELMICLVNDNTVQQTHINTITGNSSITKKELESYIPMIDLGISTLEKLRLTLLTKDSQNFITLEIANRIYINTMANYDDCALAISILENSTFIKQIMSDSTPTPKAIDSEELANFRKYVYPIVDYYFKLANTKKGLKFIKKIK